MRLNLEFSIALQKLNIVRYELIILSINSTNYISVFYIPNKYLITIFQYPISVKDTNNSQYIHSTIL